MHVPVGLYELLPIALAIICGPEPWQGAGEGWLRSARPLVEASGCPPAAP